MVLLLRFVVVADGKKEMRPFFTNEFDNIIEQILSPSVVVVAILASLRVGVFCSLSELKILGEVEKQAAKQPNPPLFNQQSISPFHSSFTAPIQSLSNHKRLVTKELVARQHVLAYNAQETVDNYIHGL